jgi:hypothetical protein
MWVDIIQSNEGPNKIKGQRRGDFSLVLRDRGFCSSFSYSAVDQTQDFVHLSQVLFY